LLSDDEHLFMPLAEVFVFFLMCIMNRLLSFFSRLRFRLALITLVTILPIFGLMLYTTSVEREFAANQAKSNELALVTLIARDYQGVIDSGRQLLVALVKVPDVLNSRQDPAGCSSFLVEIASLYPAYSNLVVVTSDGDLICSALPTGGPVSYTDRDWFQEAIRLHAFTVGEMVIGHITKAPILPLAYPILDDNGEVKLVLSVAVDMAWINQLSSSVQLPEGGIMMMLDYKGTVLAYHPDTGGVVGQTMADSPIIQTILSQHTGTTVAEGLAGTPRLYAFVPLGSPPRYDGYVAIGISTQVAYAEVNRILVYNLIGLGVVVFLAGMFAWLVGDISIMRRVRTLLAATHRVTDGDLSARTGIDKPRGELSQLAYDFDRMAESLQQRDMDRQRAEDSLGQRAIELAALQATVLEITGPHDLPALLHAIVERAAILLKANSGGLYLCDPGREEVHCVVSYNTPRDYTGTVLKYGEGAAGIVAQSGNPLVIDDYRAWSGRAAVYDKDQPFMAVLSAPMIWQGQVTGVIHVLHNTEGRHFNQTELDLLAQFANHASLAVENARLYDEAQKELVERKQAEVALSESETRFRALVEQAITGITVIQDNKLVYVNPRTAEMFGYSVDEMIGMEPTDLTVEEQREQVRESIRKRLSGEQLAAHYTFRARRKDGCEIELEVYGSTLLYQGRLATLSTLLDITERRRAEATLKHRLTELEVLYESGLKLSQLLEPRQIGQQIIEVLGQRLKWHHIAIRLYHPENESLELLAFSQPGIVDDAERREVEKRFTTLVARPGQGFSGWVIQHSESVRCSDVRRDERYVETYPGICSGLYVPLIIGQRTVGIIAIESEQLDAFSEADERMLSTLAAQAAVILENARLFEETNHRLKHVQALRTIDMAINSSLDLQVTLDIFLEQITQQLGVHAVDILRLDPHTQTLEYAAGRGFRTAAPQRTYLRLGEGLGGRTAAEQHLLHIPNLTNDLSAVARSSYLKDEGFTAYFGVPLIAKGLVKGVLEIFHRAPLAADQDWLNFLELLAGQAAIAIDNIMLFNDLQRSNMELTLAYDATIEGWSHALDLRDRETEGHTQRVAELTMRLARAMGMSAAEQVHARRGALLHDIGKLGVPDETLHKSGPLNDAEWEIMRQHPVFVYEMLAPIRYLRPALDIPYCHHEKWDGSGYPRSLAGNAIPLAARIFAVVDVYDALTSDCPYRKAWSRHDALDYIQQQSGKQFDPEIVVAFARMPDRYDLWNGDKSR